jgi:alanyl-tRNA synthetase
MISITERIRYKGGTRLTLLCGEDAFAAYQAERKVLLQIARSFSVKPLQAAEALAKKNEEIDALKESVKELNRIRIATLVKEQEGILSYTPVLMAIME